MSDMSDPETTGPTPPAVEPATPPPPPLPPSQPGSQPPSQTPSQLAAEPEPRDETRRSGPVLTALGLLVLLAGLVWLWRQDVASQQRLTTLETQVAAAPSVDPARVAALESGLEQARKQIASMQARPEAAPVDLAPLQARVAALEHRPAPPPPADLKPLEARITALEHRPAPPPPPDLKPLETRVAALENKPAVKPEDPALAAKVASLAAAQQSATRQADAAAAAARAQAAHAARLQVVQQAQAALQQGKPLGALDNAPPALARFATVAPPTEAALRLSFPQAARAAASASEPSTSGLSFTQRMWQRAQGLVTVRQGDRVVVGAPASATLAAARTRLDAGDLAGAVAALDRLDPAAAKAMASWREQAQSLLDARAALAAMAAG